MDKVATFKDFIKVREYIRLKYDYYARLGRFTDLSPEEKIEHDACWKLIKELKGFMDNVEENFEDPDEYKDLSLLLDDKVIPFDILTTKKDDE